MFLCLPVCSCTLPNDLVHSSVSHILAGTPLATVFRYELGTFKNCRNYKEFPAGKQAYVSDMFLEDYYLLFYFTLIIRICAESGKAGAVAKNEC